MVESEEVLTKVRSWTDISSWYVTGVSNKRTELPGFTTGACVERGSGSR